MSSKPGAFRLYVLILSVILLWAANYIIAKVALREIPPVLLMSLRMAIAGVIMVPFAVRELRKRSVPVTRQEWIAWSSVGIGGVMLNQFFFVLGLSKTTVTHSAMIATTAPVWVLLFAASMGMEKVTWPKLAGMGLATLGIATLQIFRPKASVNGPTVSGDLIMVLASFLFSLMTVFGKRLSSGKSNIFVNAVGYIGGGLLLAPVGWVASRSFDLSRVSLAGWLGVLYMASISSVLCYLIYYWVLEYVPASRVAAFQYLQPVLATFMAVLILGEQLTAPVMASGSIIVAGVLLTERFG